VSSGSSTGEIDASGAPRQFFASAPLPYGTGALPLWAAPNGRQTVRGPLHTLGS
jgi:hypothetical protein